LYKSFSEKYYLKGFNKKQGHWLNDYFESGNRVKFDLYKKFGIIAAAGDRHLAEFCPKNWYLSNPEMVKNWKFSLTPVSWRINNQQMKMNLSKEYVNNEKEFVVEETGEEGVSQIKAILGLADLVTNVNLPNRGQIENLPLGSIVETNAYFSSNSVKSIVSGDLPIAVNSMIIKHLLNHDLVIKSVFERNLDFAFQAFLNDPLINLEFADSKKLFEEMVNNTRKYLVNYS